VSARLVSLIGVPGSHRNPLPTLVLPRSGPSSGRGWEKVIFEAFPHVAWRHPETMKMRQPRVEFCTLASVVASNVGADGLIGPIGNGPWGRIPVSRITPEPRGCKLFLEQNPHKCDR
jgi:hypothetical protein